MKRKIFSILLSLSLVVSMIPAFGIVANADEGAPYYIWVAGVWVTDANKSDVLGDGTVSYDPSSATLTLNNAHITGTAYNEYYSAGIFISPPKEKAKTVRIELIGNNIVDSSSDFSDSNCYGIYQNGFDEQLIISGSGSLTAIGGEGKKGYSFGIYSKNLVIESGTIHATGGSGGHRQGGIMSTYGSVTIRGGNVTADNGASSGRGYGIWCSDIRIEGGQVTACGSYLNGWCQAFYSEPSLNNYSGNPEIRWSSNYTGEGAVEWDGIVSLSSAEVQYVSIKAAQGSKQYANKIVLTLSTPAAGEKPVSSMWCSGAQLKGLTWYHQVMSARGILEWEKLSASATFQDGKTYQARIELVPDSGYVFPKQSYLSITLNNQPLGGGITSLDENKMTITKEYKATAMRVNPFIDVYESDIYYDAVLWAYYANPQITNGVNATHFGPRDTVTRGQCAAFLWRAMGCPEPKSNYNPFNDVPEWQYYYKPVLWAVENGITKGTSANKFSPDQKLSTAHIITFLYRTKNKGKDGWYEEAKAWATKGYGSDQPFGVTMLVSPEMNCERAWVVYFLYKSK